MSFDIPKHPSAGNRLPSLDVLRGLAALWVVLSHYLPFWDHYLSPLPVVIPNVWGEHAVRLFFVISGFVIFGTLGRCRTLLDFAVNRFSRLYPTHWAVLTVVVVASAILFAQPAWFPSVAVNATLLQDFLGFGRYDNVYWSLTVELAFYVIAAGLFALGLHRRPLPFVLLWLLASAAWAISTETRDFDKRDLLTAALALDFAPYFAMGIVFHQSYRDGWSPAAGALLLLTAATEFLISGVPGLTVAGISAALVWAATSGRLDVLAFRPLLWLGSVSYALYLGHRNLGYEALRWLYDQGVGPGIAVPLTIAGALALAAAVTLVVEQPISSAIRRRYSRWKDARGVPGK